MAVGKPYHLELAGETELLEKSTVDRSMPYALRRSAHLGRMPVARNCPSTRSSSPMPVALKDEDVLHGDDVAFHADDLRDLHHLAGAVAEAAHLNDQVDRARDLLPGRLFGQVEAGHGNHRAETAQRVTRRVGVERGERSVVTGVHGLQHVHRFGRAHLAHDDPVGAHTERVHEKEALRHFAAALDVGRAGLEPDHVRLAQLQFRRVFDGHDPVGGRDERGQDVEQRRLAGAGAAGDQNVEPGPDGRPQELEHRLGEALGAQEVFAGQRVALELSDRQVRAVDRERLDDRVDARAVGKTGIHHRRRVVDAPADGRHDAIDDLEQVAIVLEPDFGLLQPSAALDVDTLRGVHQDVRDVRVLDQRLERAEPEDLVQDLVDENLALLELSGTDS